MSLQLRPKPQAYNALAEMAAADGDQHGAIASWVKSLELDDSQVKVHADLGRTACGLGDFERGLRHLGRAADLDRVITPEERVGNYNNLAAEAQARGLQELAVSLWERSLGVAPDQPRVQALLGQLRPGSAAPRTSLDKPIR
jgi:tetratricopeptide (TPR) repeat protein